MANVRADFYGQQLMEGTWVLYVPPYTKGRTRPTVGKVMGFDHGYVVIENYEGEEVSTHKMRFTSVSICPAWVQVRLEGED